MFEQQILLLWCAVEWKPNKETIRFQGIIISLFGVVSANNTRPLCRLVCKTQARRLNLQHADLLSVRPYHSWNVYFIKRKVINHTTNNPLLKISLLNSFILFLSLLFTDPDPVQKLVGSQ